MVYAENISGSLVPYAVGRVRDLPCQLANVGRRMIKSPKSLIDKAGSYVGRIISPETEMKIADTICYGATITSVLTIIPVMYGITAGMLHYRELSNLCRDLIRCGSVASLAQFISFIGLKVHAKSRE